MRKHAIIGLAIGALLAALIFTLQAPHGDISSSDDTKAASGQEVVALSPQQSSGSKPLEERHRAGSTEAQRHDTSDTGSSAARIGLKPGPVLEFGGPERGFRTEATQIERVAGREFPISRSIASPCREQLADPTTACAVAYEFLAHLKEEERDTAWAIETEQAVRSRLASSIGEFELRTVDCRTSLCAIEVVSRSRVLPAISYEFVLQHGLRHEQPLDGYETDEFGAEVRVTLLAFSRRR